MSEPLRLGQVLSDAGALLRQNGARMLLVTVAASSLPYLYQVIRVLTVEPTWASLEHYNDTELHNSVFVPFVMLGSIGCMMVLAKKAGWAKRLRQLVPGMGVQFLVTLLMVVGLLLLVVPGIIAWAAFAVALPIVIDEDSGARDAIQCSSDRTSGNRFAAGVALLVPSLVFGFVPYGIGYWIFSHELSKPESWVVAYRLVTLLDLVVGPMHVVASSAVAWAIHRRLAPREDSAEELAEVFS